MTTTTTRYVVQYVIGQATSNPMWTDWDLFDTEAEARQHIASEPDLAGETTRIVRRETTVVETILA